MKLSYLEMITHSLFMLTEERKGPSRDKIWKYMENQFQDHISNKKIFLTQLRRISSEENHVLKSDDHSGRFRLDPKFRVKYTKCLRDGLPIPKALTHALTTRTTNERKPASENSKAKMSKTSKGKQILKEETKRKDRQTKQK